MSSSLIQSLFCQRYDRSGPIWTAADVSAAPVTVVVGMTTVGIAEDIGVGSGEVLDEVPVVPEVAVVKVPELVADEEPVAERLDDDDEAPVPRGTDEEEDETPVPRGIEEEEEETPVPSGTEEEEDDTPVPSGIEVDEEGEFPVLKGGTMDEDDNVVVMLERDTTDEVNDVVKVEF